MERNIFTQSRLEWLAALESGEWKQGTINLCTIQGDRRFYCCLGVRAEQLGLRDQTETGNGCAYFQDGENCECTLAPDAVIDDLQLFTSTGGIRGGVEIERCEVRFKSLAGANDNGLTFPEIAAFIRAEPWRVFQNFDKPQGVA